MPTLTPDGDVLLKLILRGQDPAEIQQLAQATQGELNRQSKLLLDQLTALHKGATEAQTADVLNQIQKEIKARQGALATVTTIIDSQAKQQAKLVDAAQKAADKQAATAKKLADDNIKELERNFEFAVRLAKMKEKEDAAAAARTKQLADDAATAAHRNSELQIQAFEAITVAAEAAFEIIKGGFERFHQLGEQIIKNAQIYGSLRGSIDSLREATGGEVADIDLITTKNRAFEKDLKLTDEQFAAVAKQAKHYGDVLGTDTKDGLDKLVDGLATGRVKMLQSAGVIVDTEAAYRKFADAQGLVIDKMTDQEKLLAFQTAALEKIKEKTKEFGEEGVTVANVLEIAFAKTKNAITGTLAAIGNAKLSAPTDYGAGDLERIRQDSIAHGDPGEYQRALAVRAKARAEQEAQRREAARRDYTDEEMAARQDQLLGNYDADPSKTKSYTEAETAAAALGGGERYGAYSKPISTTTAAELQEAYKRREAAIKKAEEAQKKIDEFNQQWDDLLRQMGGAKKGDVTDGRGAVDTVGAGPNTYALDKTLAAAKRRKAEEDEADQQRLAIQSAEAMDKINTDAMQEMQAKSDALVAMAGGGLFAHLVFGNDGIDGFLASIDTAQEHLAKTMGAITDMMSEAAKAEADAIGHSLTALITGEKMKTSLADQTNMLLRALAARAAGEAIWEGAQGLAMTALALFGNPLAAASAGAHFAAAAAYGALAGGSALAARGFGSTSAEREQDAADKKKATKASAGMSTSTSGSGGFGSNGQRSSGGGDGQQLVINVSTLYGSPEEIGRSLDIALAARKAQTGRLLSQETA